MQENYHFLNLSCSYLPSPYVFFPFPLPQTCDAAYLRGAITDYLFLQTPCIVFLKAATYLYVSIKKWMRFQEKK